LADRFVETCLADDRIVAAFLGGSDAEGYAGVAVKMVQLY
jgi:hypothetical protein